MRISEFLSLPVIFVNNAGWGTCTFPRNFNFHLIKKNCFPFSYISCAFPAYIAHLFCCAKFNFRVLHNSDTRQHSSKMLLSPRNAISFRPVTLAGYTLESIAYQCQLPTFLPSSLFCTTQRGSPSPTLAIVCLCWGCYTKITSIPTTKSTIEQK